MKERLSANLGEEANDIWASTFHSLCVRILRRFGDRIGFESKFLIYDTYDSKRLMKECMRLLDVDEKTFPVKSVLGEISRAKDMLIGCEEYEKSAGEDFRKATISKLYAQYEKMLKNSNAMDFDDLICRTIELLKKDSEVRELYQRQFRYVMVDEYQDTNYAQYVLVKILADGWKNICVVGDDDQSIYKFRGATIENILNFEEHFSNATVIRLEQNYRSTDIILQAANAVIENNTERKGKKLWTEKKSSDRVHVYTASTEIDEAKFVANSISDYIHDGGNWKDNAILYRMNAQSNAIESIFVKMGIPYRVIGGTRFYERKEIRDAVSFLSVINNPSDTIRLNRIINEPKRGIGEATINHALEISNALGISLFEVISTADQYEKLRRSYDKLNAFVKIMEELIEAAETVTLSELFEMVMDKTGYMKALKDAGAQEADRVENLEEFLTTINHYQEENPDLGLSDFLEEIALMTDIDNYENSSDSVVMMTIHSAKGLEFSNVYIVGMEDGIFPGYLSLRNQSELEEERRLAYVGITRAKKRLFLTNTTSRMLYGKTARNSASRFLKEIPDDCIIDDTPRKTPTSVAPKSRKAPTKAIDRSFGQGGLKMSAATPKSYAVGDIVKHKTFGAGVVVAAKKMGNDTMLEIAFEKVGTKKLMANYAPLQKG